MKVFLSSTAVDLEAHRGVADDTILRLSQQAVVMERFGPLPGEPAAECERKARDCDVVVCVVAHRYGYEPEAGKGSITRREVDAARAAGKDVLVWIVADDHPWSEPREQDRLTDPSVLADPERVAAVARSVRALQEFKRWLRASFVCDTFTTPDDLGKKIAVALSTYAKEQAPDGAPPAIPARGEVRIVHALQPAPHFHGRGLLLEELSAWAADLASADRVWALVAPGGSGKTAIAERLVASMEPGAANVLVWSFYERPHADAFLRECNQLFLGEEEGPAGGRLERLERGLRDGRPHLIVLDGLERVQEEAGGGRLRGELSDHNLKLLLRALAAGLGRARALVTSRFPLVDLEDWSRRGYRDIRLDDLAPEAAVAVLRGWGVVGTEVALAAAAAQVGRHALSVAVIGSYLRSFAAGRIEAVADFDLDAVTGDDPRAAKLARVLAFYAQRLPDEERELLARLAVFPRGVSLELLGTLVEAGGEVAGLLVNARPRLLSLLKRLKDRGLVFTYQSAATITWTAHPFLRDRFRLLLGCPSEHVFAVLADVFTANLGNRPEFMPSEPAELDRYEQMIEVIRLAGRERRAFAIFKYNLGGYEHLGKKLGEYIRGYRILKGLSHCGQPQKLDSDWQPHLQRELYNALSLFSIRLGKLHEARSLLKLAIHTDLRRQSYHEWVLSNISNHSWNLELVLSNISKLSWDLDLFDSWRAEHDDGGGMMQGDYHDSVINHYPVITAQIPFEIPSHELSNISNLSIMLGRLSDAKKFSTQAVMRALHDHNHRLRLSVVSAAFTMHLQGDIFNSRKLFIILEQIANGVQDSIGISRHSRHFLDLGNLKESRDLAQHGLAMATLNRWNFEIPRFHDLLARLALAEGNDPTAHLDAIRAWTSRTGDMEWIITAHLLAARQALAIGDNQAALAEAELGLLHAETCGHKLLRIELLIALARLRLAWPDPPAAIQAARQALDLATGPECGYAWGEADAAQAWGEAFVANGEPELAQRAFSRAHVVRQRIRHPGIKETESWLARIS
jgi:tetratricopeptide (TPR) repeat protein